MSDVGVAQPRRTARPVPLPAPCTSLVALEAAVSRPSVGLEPDAKSFPARAMATTQAGDWPDAEHVARWVDEVDGELRSIGS